MSTPAYDPSISPRQTRLLILAFLTAGVTGVLHHEIWLDEAHHWLIARDSGSLSELWRNTRYEGHPVLWNALLFLISRLTTNVLYMQLAHVAIAGVAVCLFLLNAPFKFIEKILFISGYFILYEYTVISRNYSLLMVFLFLSLMLYHRNQFTWLGLTLAVLANTHFFGLIMSTGIFLMAAFERWLENKTPRTRPVVPGLLIFLAGMAISIYQIIPPSDSVLIAEAQLVSPAERMGRTSAIFLKAFMPVPDLANYRYWNSNIFMALSKPLSAVLSIVLFALPFFLFKNRFSLLLFFYSAASCLIAFFYFSDLHAARYFGGIYLIFITCMWHLRSAPLTPGVEWIFRSPLHWRHRMSKSPDDSQRSDSIVRFFRALLIVQAAAGITAYALDIIRPFSGSREAAMLMLGKKDVTEYISGGCGSAPVSAYLGRKVYYMNQSMYGSFCSFNKGLEHPITTSAMLKEAAIRHVRQTHVTSFLIAHRPVEILPGEARFIRAYGNPAKSALRNENYHIYIVSDGGLQPPVAFESE